MIAPVQTFFHTRNLVVKLFDDMCKDKWVRVCCACVRRPATTG